LTRSRIAASRGSGHEHESARSLGKLCHCLRELELLGRGNPGGNQPEDRRGPAFLAEEVHAETRFGAHLVGEIDVAGLPVLGPDPRRSDGTDEVVEVALRKGAIADLLEVPVDPDDRRRADREVEIGTVSLRQNRQEPVDPVGPRRDDVVLADLNDFLDRLPGLLLPTRREDRRRGRRVVHAALPSSRKDSNASLRSARS